MANLTCALREVRVSLLVHLDTQWGRNSGVTIFIATTLLVLALGRIGKGCRKGPLLEPLGVVLALNSAVLPSDRPVAFAMAGNNFTIRGDIALQLYVRTNLQPCFSHDQLRRSKPGFRANVRNVLARVSGS